MIRVKQLFESILKKLLGFSVVGIITTLLSGGLIYVIIHMLKGPLVLSYILIYTLAIILSFVLNMIFVFKNQINLKGAAIYFGIYLSGMGLGALFLEYFKDILDIPDVIKAYLAIPVTLTWNFGLSYLVFNKPENYR